VADYNPLADEIEEEPASRNKQVALVIAVLALLLTIAEILGQSAQTRALQSNIEAANLWSFYQAKHMRETALTIAAEEMESNLASAKDEQQRQAMRRRIDEWRTLAAHYQSDPASNEGRKELTARAKEAERSRDEAERLHHFYELAKGSFQIAIVVASAAMITEVWALLWGTWGLGGLGLLLLAAAIL
jgi:hypothetical protein